MRITVGLPLKVEEALISEWRSRKGFSSPETSNTSSTVIFPRKVCLLIRGVVVFLEKMETVLS
jgi:hypothetical protein